MASREHVYFVAYDIGDPRRGRAVFNALHGYGEWVQLSVFQCRLTRLRHAEMVADMDRLTHRDEDHVVVIDAGPADHAASRVVSLGKRAYTPVDRQATIV